MQIGNDWTAKCSSGSRVLILIEGGPTLPGSSSLRVARRKATSDRGSKAGTTPVACTPFRPTV
eukprot:9488639-Pyramimonas_sp.AAC.2